MTDAKFYPRQTENEGWVDEGASPTPFNASYFGGMSIETFRHFIWRFADVDIPAGATISAVNVVLPMYVKNSGDPNSITYDFFYQSVSVADTTMRQDTLPLRLGVYEENNTNRPWTSLRTSQSWSWTNGVGTADQNLLVDVTTLVSTAINSNAGRHMNVAFRMKVTAETGDVGISANARDGKAPYLQITYTGGTARNEVVLYNENPSFEVVKPSNTLAEYWFNNPIFGFFSNATTYACMTSDGAITPPMGGKMMKVTATDTNRQAAWRAGMNHTIPPGTWSMWSAYVYVPSSSNFDVFISPFSGLNGQGERISVKDTWVRTSFHSLAQPDLDATYGIVTGNGVAVGNSFYIANVNWTPGDVLYPYFDGDTADDATHHRTFDWGGGTTGKSKGGYGYVVLDSAPTGTGVSPQTSQSTHKYLYSTWNYSDTYSESQSRVRVEIRKKKVP